METSLFQELFLDDALDNDTQNGDNNIHFNNDDANDNHDRDDYNDDK